MRHAAEEGHAILDAEAQRLPFQLLFGGAAAGEDHGDVVALVAQQSDRIEQDVEAFIRIERAEEAEHDLAIEAELHAQLFLAGRR